MRKAVFISVLLFCIFFFTCSLFILNPVPVPPENKCLVITGEVSKIFAAGQKDIIFQLADINKKFYINRGLEKGLSIDELNTALLQKEITIKYPKYWTPLDFTNSIKHISKVEFKGKTIYTELES